MRQPLVDLPPEADQAFRLRAAAALDRYLHPEPLLVVISGPSGVGKDSVVNRMRELEYPFHFVVTATDRPPRPGEVHGVDYYFVSTAEFQRMIAEDELFEHAIVYGQHKGVPKAHAREALSSGKDVVMRLDVQGAMTVAEKLPGALTVFLAPPSLEILVRRLRRRAADSPTQIRQRLETALYEMGRIGGFDYVVVNREGRLDHAVQQVVSIIAAAKCRADRQVVAL